MPSSNDHISRRSSLHSFIHMEQKAIHFASIVDDRVLGHHPPLQYPPPQQQQVHHIPVASHIPVETRLKPNLPRRYLFKEGGRERYLKIGVPLYEASIRCDWKAAKSIIDQNRDLVRYSITENGETALHVAASAKIPKKMDKFVKNLVDLMTPEDLALENENFNTALYLASAAGNIKMVKMIGEKNRGLLVIPGDGGQMMPLYAAASSGHYEVVKYLYENSKDLMDDGWNPKNRGWLLEKCVEGDMFDIAIKIVDKHRELDSIGNVLSILARKPDGFSETKSSIMVRTIDWCKHRYSLMFIRHHQPFQSEYLEVDSDTAHKEVDSETAHKDFGRKPEASPKTKFNIIMTTIKSGFASIGFTMEAPEKERKALQLLRIIWEDIARKPRNEIDKILRGPPDSIKQDMAASDRVVQAMQLEKLISQYLHKMGVKTHNIIRGQPDSTKQHTNPAFGKVDDEALNLKNLISELLVNLHAETKNITKGPPDSMTQDNELVFGKGDEALELQKLISKHIVNMRNETRKIFLTYRKEDQSHKLQNAIFESIVKMKKETKKIITRLENDKHSSRVLFIAAEMGNTNFIVELIRQYPDLLWKVNDNNQTIFHIAVKLRHAGIYNLLYEIGSMKDLILPLRDEDDNTMLHLVGKSTKKKRLEDVSGAALQMQRELLWFKEVESMMPPSHRERKNRDGLTARELFTEEHQDLITQGEKWMKGTASQSMVVAALIATIVFAAAFTVPGGYDNKGIPTFYRKLTFVVFVVADAISLFLSTTSILTFLSILTSRYAEQNFLKKLPNKLMLGLSTLFLSITAMMVAFSVSFFILYHSEMKWIPILISLLAVLPVLLYVALQYHLLVDVFRSTYGSKYLFKPWKQVLYFKNPRV